MMEFVICLFVVAVPPLENFVCSGKQKKQRRKLKSRKRKKKPHFFKGNLLHLLPISFIKCNLGSKGNKFHQSW